MARCALAAAPVWLHDIMPDSDTSSLQFLEFRLSHGVLIKQCFQPAPRTKPSPGPHTEAGDLAAVWQWELQWVCSAQGNKHSKPISDAKLCHSQCWVTALAKPPETLHNTAPVPSPPPCVAASPSLPKPCPQSAQLQLLLCVPICLSNPLGMQPPLPALLMRDLISEVE